MTPPSPSATARLSCRERIDVLFDPGTFEEVDALVTHRCRDFGMAERVVPGDGVIAGSGRINEETGADMYRRSNAVLPGVVTMVDPFATW